jgi:hypothetical protein
VSQGVDDGTLSIGWRTPTDGRGVGFLLVEGAVAEHREVHVEFAREEANSTEVTDQRVGDAVFGYLFR